MNHNESPNIPSWYWHRGIHDARILSVIQLEFSAYQTTPPAADNCLAIYLNSEKAVYETDVAKIALYNYELTDDFDFRAHGQLWWLWDQLSMENDRYRLDITVTAEDHSRKQVTVSFDWAEVTRNQIK